MPLQQVILNDPGGFISGHIAYGAFLKAIHAKVIVVYCASACLALLSQLDHDQVCFRPQAWIGHHTAAQHNNPDGICCIEDTNTMRWLRGVDMIARGWQAC